jgi:hypothetical protein
MISVKRSILIIASLLFLLSNTYAETALEKCSDQFINGNVSNAPTMYNSQPNEPFGNNTHLCYRDDGVSFFAIEYWPNEYAPRWGDDWFFDRKNGRNIRSDDCGRGSPQGACPIP